MIHLWDWKDILYTYSDILHFPPETPQLLQNMVNGADGLELSPYAFSCLLPFVICVLCAFPFFSIAFYFIFLICVFLFVESSRSPYFSLCTNIPSCLSFTHAYLIFLPFS